ncbi:hypothetical protein JCM11251_001354 [Rhodosporidiobolus azoricus]
MSAIIPRAAAALVPGPLLASFDKVLADFSLASVPRPLKVLFWLYLIANLNGVPGVWHLRIIWPFTKFGWQVKMGKKWPNDRVGRDEFTHQVEYSTKTFRATPDSCDSFGFHLSNSEYAVTLDHVRGPYSIQLIGEYWMIPGASFALGAANYSFKKEIPLMAKYEIHNELVGYEKKWMYIRTTFRSLPHPKTGARTTYAEALTHFVLKHNRRTIPPARAFALTGYDSDHGKGRENWEIVKTMTAKDKLKWLVNEHGEGKGKGIVVGSEERGMENKGKWPGQL